MQCTAPQTYYHADPAKNGGRRGLTKSPRKALGLVGDLGTVTVPCGRCMDCRLRAAYEWSLRVMHESELYSSNLFVTLTYDDEHVPADYGLNYYHFQLFMHSLRKEVRGAGRFFMCGEYGEQFGRPHYHAILFNCFFEDMEFWKVIDDNRVYTSDTLSALWGRGFCSIGEVNLDSAGYVARYTTKKVTGPEAGSAYQYVSADGEVFDREPPFLQPSLKPGIGAGWFERFKGDVFPCDYLVYDGKRFPVPRYYSKLLEREAEAEYKLVKSRRRAKMLLRKDDEEHSSRRLRDKHEHRLLVSANKRSLS